MEVFVSLCFLCSIYCRNDDNYFRISGKTGVWLFANFLRDWVYTRWRNGKAVVPNMWLLVFTNSNNPSLQYMMWFQVGPSKNSDTCNPPSALTQTHTSNVTTRISKHQTTGLSPWYPDFGLARFGFPVLIYLCDAGSATNQVKFVISPGKTPRLKMITATRRTDPKLYGTGDGSIYRSKDRLASFSRAVMRRAAESTSPS